MLFDIKSVLLLCGVMVSSLGKYQHAAFAIAATPNPSSKESYIVMMKDEPILTHDIDTTQSHQQRKLNRKSANSNGKNKRYQKYLKNKHAQAAEAVGISKKDMTHEYYYCSNGFQMYMTDGQAAEMKNQEGVAQVVKDQMISMDDVMPDSGTSSRRLSESRSSALDVPVKGSNQGSPSKVRDLTAFTPEFLGLTDQGGPWDKGINGEGVVVGMVDSGLWPEHPSFADDNDAYDPLPGFAPNSDSLPCEFGNTAHNANDSPFTCNNKLLGARLVMDTFRKEKNGFGSNQFDSARDDVGHGTHTASIAAGNRGVDAITSIGSLGKISGMAHRARIIAYKAIEAPPNNGFASDIMKAIDYACQDGVDVINFSISISGSGLADIAFLNAAKAGILVAAAAGNDGPGPSTTSASAPWYTTVASSSQSSTIGQGSVSSSDGGWEYFGASITNSTDMEIPLVDGEEIGSELCLPGKLNDASVEGKIVLCKRALGEDSPSVLVKSKAVSDAGGKGMILYNANDFDTQNLLAHSVPSVHIKRGDGLAIKEYIKAAGPKAVAQITVPVQDKNAPIVADTSSRGPNPRAPDIIKPDITAPGVNILAGWSPASNQGPALFSIQSGTSMASPHAAGMFALISQAHPDWSPAMAKSAIMTTSYQEVKKREGGTLISANPFDMGAGHVNGGEVTKGSMFEPGLVYDAEYNDYMAFLCDGGKKLLGNLYKQNITLCEELETRGFASEAWNLNYPSIGISNVAGKTNTVTRRVTSVAKEKGNRVLKYKAVVVSPEGYEVSVEPSTIRLKQGETVPFEVTVTNVDAPFGMWKYGSLTWVEKSGKYEVYSPIAVNSILFDYPSKVLESGKSGTSSFDVSFGYSGGYNAESYGLTPATVSLGTVNQATPTLDNPDVNTFELVGVFYFRVAIPPEAVENGVDLQMVLYDPSGVTSGVSAVRGKTDELIEVTLPKDGIWTLAVFGVNTLGSSAEYDLYSWIVSVTPVSGSLSLQSAPSSAVKGKTETIDIAWDDAVLGERQFGVISHMLGLGLVGLTVVEIDNRGTEAENVSVVSQISGVVEEPAHEQFKSGSHVKQASVWTYAFVSIIMMMWK